MVGVSKPSSTMIKRILNQKGIDGECAINASALAKAGTLKAFKASSDARTMFERLGSLKLNDTYEELFCDDAPRDDLDMLEQPIKKNAIESRGRKRDNPCDVVNEVAKKFSSDIQKAQNGISSPTTRGASRKKRKAKVNSQAEMSFTSFLCQIINGDIEAPDTVTVNTPKSITI